MLPVPGIGTLIQAKTVFLAAAPRGVLVGAVFRNVGAPLLSQPEFARAAERHHNNAAIARPTSAVLAVPPMSGVRGACGSANIRSMACTTSAAASA